MIKKHRYNLNEDNPILARVRQFYESEKSDPYIIFLENLNDADTEVTLFDAQNNIATPGFNLPAGIAVNLDFNYVSNTFTAGRFDAGTGLFLASTTLTFITNPPVNTHAYDISGLTLEQAAQKVNKEQDTGGGTAGALTNTVCAIVAQSGTNNLTVKLGSDLDNITNVNITSSITANFTKTDSDFLAFAGARTKYVEFLQQISIKPMVMEGNFLNSGNVTVISTNDVIDKKLDVNGHIQRTFLTLNLDPYMRPETRTLTNFNLLDSQTSLTLTLGADSTTSIYLYATETIDAAEQLNPAVNPENMDDCEIEAPAKPFEDYDLPTGGLSM